ncbi:formylglycine-generating enzyme family protein [Treponema vincentii]|uniref:Formylglycine-generating enzyme family protein n=1 Tax=Treponema vincentii TaxID=69710 RepID=A0A6P1Y0M0_9SPIR|nr:SUMF1/EgtB/PvdO family nonheme iron enzyme [Treponema vincentii]QHX43297.1 formylglycine-generating enzyme family protein [Treponema vincentii]
MDKKGRTNRLLSRLAVGLMLAAMALFTGCPNKITVKPVTFEVTFSAGEHGTLKAKADGIAETETSPITIEQGKTVTFRATPDSGYRVKGWTCDGEAVNGTNAFYSFTVTKGVEVKVSFESNSVPPTPPSGDVGSFEDTGDNFIKISPPAAGITGKDPTYTLPGTGDDWKGVFRAGRKVTLSPYKLGKTEVPYKLWKEVYDWATQPANGYKFANAGVKGKDGSGSEEEPVTSVSWRDCIVWCNAYTQKIKGEGECVYRKKDDHTVVLKDATDGDACDNASADMRKKGYRLPTEAEWEYAARWQGSDNTNAEQYGEVWLTKLNSASGAKADWNNADATKAVAWYGDNSNSKTHPVGEKRSNALGLHDMSGNVWEWCFDWYGNIEAGDGTDPQGGASGVRRVIRGGSWNSIAGGCVVGYRNLGIPDFYYVYLGFRVAMSKN